MELPKNKKIYFASDQHFGAPTPTLSKVREEYFLRWLNEIEKNAAEEQIKKMTNSVLTANTKKAEETFKKVVSANKQYFEGIATFGEEMETEADVKFKDFGNKFCEEPLDYEMVNTLVSNHL